ncbi:MAG: hypothetical protein ACYCWW_03765 [Deltaproteobacteria bacterium]
MRTLIAVGGCLLLGLGCQGTRTPCDQSDAGCLPIVGTYYAIMNPIPACPSWEQNIPPSSVMQITAAGSQLSVALWPNTSTTHTLVGTLYSDGTIYVGENVQNVTIGLPYATLSGRFQGEGDGGVAAPPFYFAGQLVLQGTSGGPTTGGQAAGGAGGGCQTSVQFTAQQQASILVDLDGGSPTATDGGADAG